MKILLTGFNSFGDQKVNPSELVVENLAKKARRGHRANLICEVLPTEYIAAGERIVHLIKRHRPQRIICLGLASDAKSIHLERVALNLDDTDTPDNAGLSRKGQPIIPDGPMAYRTTLPIEEIHLKLSRDGIPTVISNHAGTYICNHVFYLARHEVETLGMTAMCGFIHLPHLPRFRGEEDPCMDGLPLETMVKAVKNCLRIVAED